MSLSYTLVPSGEFWLLVERIRAAASRDGRILVRSDGPDTCLYFAGDVGVAWRVATGGSGLAGLACLRILEGSYVFHIEAEGYEASVEHLATFLAKMLRVIGPYRLLEDETGDDETWRAARLPERMFDPEPEFVEDVEDFTDVATENLA